MTMSSSPLIFNQELSSSSVGFITADRSLVDLVSLINQRKELNVILVFEGDNNSNNGENLLAILSNKKLGNLPQDKEKLASIKVRELITKPLITLSESEAKICPS